MHWYQNLNNNDKLTISHINNSILEKAVIIDFEGPKEGKPELVGYFKDNKFKTIFLNDAFESCKTRYSAGCMTLDEFTDLILKDINEEDRLVIAFSVHEADILLDYFEGSPVHWYRDAHKYFKKYLFHRRYPRPTGWNLDSILEFYDIEKTNYGERKISGYIQYAKRDLLRKGHYDQITKSAKTKLTKALNYNREDVLCLYKAISISLNKLEGQ